MHQRMRARVCFMFELRAYERAVFFKTLVVARLRLNKRGKSRRRHRTPRYVYMIASQDYSCRVRALLRATARLLYTSDLFLFVE